MGKLRYKYNPDSLSYDRVKPSFKKRVLQFFSYLSILVFIAFMLNVLYSSFFDTPKEKMLKRENSQLQLQYEKLNQQISTLESVLSDIEKRDDNIYRSIFNATPIPPAIRDAGIGGVNRYESLEGYDNSGLVIETARQIDQLTKAVYVQSTSFDEVIEMARNMNTVK